MAMHTTLNGKVDDLNAWFHGLTDDHYTEVDRRLATYDTVLVGRATYEAMATYWPRGRDRGRRPTDQQERGPEDERLQEVRLLLQPGRTTTAGMEQRGNGDGQLRSGHRHLHQRPEGPAWSRHLPGRRRAPGCHLCRLGLVDEYRLAVFPVVAPGVAWFDQIADQRDMQLISATPYENGAIGLYFKPHDAK